MLKDHIQKQTVLKIAFFASLLYVFVRAVFAYVVNMYFFTNCCYHIVLAFFICFGFSITAIVVNEKVLFVKSRDSLQNMHKSTMVSRFVWLQVNNTQVRN